MDTGVGIPPEVLPKLCMPFQTFNLNSMNGEGIGLGLSICKNLLGFLGPKDQFEIESEHKKGAKFSFTIYQNIEEISNESSIIMDNPFKRSSTIFNPNENMGELEIEEKKHIEFVKYNETLSNYSLFNRVSNKIEILIVDDDAFNIEVLKKILKKVPFKFEIDVAFNGNCAVNQFKKRNKIEKQDNICNIDVIIMDCEMPILNGFQASKIIKNLGKYHNCKILLHTAYVSENIKEKIKEYYIDGLLEKPCNPEIINKYMQKLNN